MEDEEEGNARINEDVSYFDNTLQILCVNHITEWLSISHTN